MGDNILSPDESERRRFWLWLLAALLALALLLGILRWAAHHPIVPGPSTRLSTCAVSSGWTEMIAAKNGTSPAAVAAKGNAPPKSAKAPEEGTNAILKYLTR